MQSTLNSQSSESLWETVELPQLKDALGQLSMPSQRAIYLRFWESNSIEEIANAIGISWDEADKLINESLKQLKTLLPKNCQLKLSKPAA